MKLNETITINLGLGRTVSLECSDFLNLTRLFLEAVDQREDSLYGLAGEIMFAVVRPCQDPQLEDIKRYSKEMEDIRDFIEAELMETTTTTTTVSISNELDQLESEAEAIESV